MAGTQTGYQELKDAFPTWTLRNGAWGSAASFEHWYFTLEAPCSFRQGRNGGESCFEANLSPASFPMVLNVGA